MITYIIGTWLTFQLGAIVGYLLCLNGPRPRRRYPTPPKLRVVASSGSASLTPAEILDVLRQCSFGVFDISEKSPNTLLEIGAMFGLGKFVILLARWPKASPIPADLLGHEILGYTRSTQLRKGLARYFRRLKRSLAQQQTLVPGQGVRPRA